MNSRKHNALTSLLLTIIIGAGLAACSSPAKLPRLANDAVIVAFGDSLTFGTGAEPMQSYPAVLEQMIGWRVVNAGVPGEVTGEGLSRLSEILERDKPALLLLCHGGNDHLRRLNQQQSANNIREMIRLARDRGVAVLLIAVPAPGLSLSPSPMYREIAKELSMPLEEKILSEVLADASLKSDLIHPNAAGYHRMAESVAALLKKSGAID
ncbi:MAG: arylesterase [Deltaproteobacteria bacterium RBG_16_44_11]|nr:MAG: arylesterase [Deltaproteobacteria bacterium RBG_16_44_11]